MPKYYVKDLIKNILIPFDSETDLARWWRRINGLKYDNLNMNGKDTHTVRTIQYYPTLSVRTETLLRPYMIIEAHTNRIIDIRNWHIETFPEPKYSYHHYYGSGRKNHYHRKGAAPLMMNTLRNEDKIKDFDPDDYEGNIIKQLRSKPSHFNKTCAYDYAETAHHHDWSSSKCWKDQCKAPKQYWRHKKGFGPMPKPEDGSDEFDIMDTFDPSFESNTDVA